MVEAHSIFFTAAAQKRDRTRVAIKQAEAQLRVYELRSTLLSYATPYLSYAAPYLVSRTLLSFAAPCLSYAAAY
jgi:hypothetical protein